MKAAGVEDRLRAGNRRPDSSIIERMSGRPRARGIGSHLPRRLQPPKVAGKDDATAKT